MVMSADLLAAVAACQQEVATLRSDLTRIEAANADLYYTMEQAMRQRDEADAAASSLAAQLAELEAANATLRLELDDANTIISRRERESMTLMRAIDGLNRARMAADLAAPNIERVTAERNELAAQWNSIPWQAIEDVLTDLEAWVEDASPESTALLIWLRTNRPQD